LAGSVYIETTVLSAHFSHREDAASVYRRDVTRQWWAQQSAQYELCTSLAVLAELQSGSYPGQQDAVELADSLARIEVSDEALGVAEVYVRHRLMPASRAGDALHLALATLNEIDYLLTWNIRHLANPNKVEHMTVINRRLGLLSPIVVSPDMLWDESP